MRSTESVLVPAPPADVFEYVSELDRYPDWLALVPDAVRVDGVDPPAWSVELRASIGPFARSKRLRMTRSTLERDRLVEFERAEVDGREHARWALRVELEPSESGSTLVTMHLAYDGGLWTGGLLEQALEREIRHGREGLVRLVSGEPTR